MERITGSRRPTPEMVSFKDSQKDSADSGVDPGLGRMGGLLTGSGSGSGAGAGVGVGAEDTAGAGVGVRWTTSANCDGTMLTGGRVG